MERARATAVTQSTTLTIDLKQSLPRLNQSLERRVAEGDARFSDESQLLTKERQDERLAAVALETHCSYELREPVEVRVNPDCIEILSYPGPDASIRIEALDGDNIV